MYNFRFLASCKCKLQIISFVSGYFRGWFQSWSGQDWNKWFFQKNEGNNNIDHTGGTWIIILYLNSKVDEI